MAEVGIAYFYPMLYIALAIFAIGLYINLSIWAKGEKRGVVSKVPLNKKVSLVLKAFFWDVLLQERIFRESKTRWAMHFSIFCGFFGLFLLSGISFVLELFGIFPFNKDAPFFAFGFDLFGLMMLIGIAIALYQRFIVEVPQLKTSLEDKIAIATLAILIPTGFIVEAVRLISEEIAPEVAIFSFVGYSIAKIMGSVSLPWASIYSPLLYLHVMIALAFIAYIPYGKFFHILAGPLSIFLDSLEGEE
ncbi:MAG: respiratory nitrate reductase subunit gamma [Candidatus Hydrothermarchaeales archaeon]